MTGPSSLRGWLERPLRERDRQRAFALAAAALVLAAAILTLTGRDHHQPPPAAATPPTSPAAVPPPVSPAPAVRAPAREREPEPAPRSIRRVARRFLAGYLPYLYGQRPARRIDASTPQLRRRLAANRPRVSPAARRRRPRVVALEGERALAGRWLVRARIADGSVVAYPIELLIDGRRVVAIGGE
jgi:hypothetical protein